MNAGILQAHHHGLVSCASLVACGRAFEGAVAALRATPSLCLAVHVTLVEERPVSAPSAIPSLVGPDGSFLPNYGRFLRRFLAGAIRSQELRREIVGQVERIYAAGLLPLHLNSHQHLHMLPRIWEIVLQIAEDFHIPMVRLSRFQQPWEGWPFSDWPFRAGLNRLAARAAARAAQRAIAARLVATVGLDVAGHLGREKLLHILRRLPTGVHELVVHPGVEDPELRARYTWGYDWSGELEALCSPLGDELQRLGIQLESCKT